MRRLRLTSHTVSVFFLTILFSGCYTVRYAIPPEHESGNYEVIEKFEVKKKVSWVIFGLVPVSEAQVESIVKEQVQRYNGDAATNIEIEAQYDAADVIVAILVGGLFNTRTYTIRGDIVRFKNQRTSTLYKKQKNLILGAIRYR